MALQVSHQIFQSFYFQKLQSLIFTFTANTMGIYRSKLNWGWDQLKVSVAGMLSTMVNAYSTSVALMIVTFCDFIAI